MLSSKGNPFNHAHNEQAVAEDSLYVRNYKPTDIFFSKQEASIPKKRVTDRNRSSVFDTDLQAPSKPTRIDRMASDVFFGGNVSTRFGDYEPSVSAPRRSSAGRSSQQDSIDASIHAQNEELLRMEQEYREEAKAINHEPAPVTEQQEYYNEAPAAPKRKLKYSMVIL